MDADLQIENIYRTQILELYRDPLNKKVLRKFDAQHKEFNPSCGDEISVQIQFDGEGRVADIGHQGQGCAISQAAVSLLTDEVRGMDKEKIRQLDDSLVFELLGFEPIYTRVKCATLGFNCIKKAIS